ILQVADQINLVLWPVAMDFKYAHIETMKDREITLSMITGSVRNSEHVEVARLLREKSEIVLALGACATLGGTSGLANFVGKEDIFNWVYRDAPTVVNPQGNVPQTEIQVNGKQLTLPEFFDHVYTLGQVIDVDYYLPGCPPPPALIAVAINAVLSDDLPPKGATFGERRALCDSCPRNQRKPSRIEIKEIRRIHEVEAEPDACFLEQGIICMGPATRGGCEQSCINVNIPCRGCFGPVPGVADAGARYLSALTSMLKADTDEDARQVIDSIYDPAGYFYRFCLPSSILGRKRVVTATEVEHV
ncbi:MAG: oxidoreductase, partial [Deltaproteobacteria bacterium]|nr:oxidoreductase [Deltaproteobacteria bacterium]